MLWLHHAAISQQEYSVFTAGSCKALNSAAGFLHILKTSSPPVGAKRQGETGKRIAMVSNIPWDALRQIFRDLALAPCPHLPHGGDCLTWEGCSPPCLSCLFCPRAAKLQFLIVAFFFSLLCLSTLSTGFLSPSPADVRVDYKAIQLEKLPRNETNNVLNCSLHKNLNSGLNF